MRLSCIFPQRDCSLSFCQIISSALKFIILKTSCKCFHTLYIFTHTLCFLIFEVSYIRLCLQIKTIFVWSLFAYVLCICAQQSLSLFIYPDSSYTNVVCWQVQITLIKIAFLYLTHIIFQAGLFRRYTTLC